MWFVFRLLHAVTACLLLAHCAGQPTPVTPPSKVEWYVASKDPLTYCPKGHRLPQPGTSEMIGVEYVYLMDGSARYHIPRDCKAHRKQALDLRDRSKSARQKAGESTGGIIGKTMEIISMIFYLGAVAASGVGS